MKPGAGKRKGGAFEREVAKELSNALYGNPDELWRTKSSGSKVEHPGDICPVRSNVFFPYVVECKDVTVGGWSLDDFFKDKNNLIIQWWNKLLDDRGLAGETYKNYNPLLIITKNYFPILAVTNMITLTPPQWAVFHFNTVDSLIVLPFESLLAEFKRNREQWELAKTGLDSK